ncbi:hypothetical protein IKQ21_07045 [bacterium]|nr:hypothetical protein [bacterium]
MSKGLEFDPGFAPYIMAFQGTVEYLYSDINRFKNLSQKKVKFMQYHKKILEVFNNNVGFYTGCLMWAAYIKTQKEQPILNNGYLGLEYKEEENTPETDFTLRFIELFPKDMQYFLGKKFEFEPELKKLTEMYREFLVINKGFVEAKNNTDIKLPEGMLTEDAQSFKEKIDSVIKEGDLSKLLEFISLICPKEK